jgi:transposase
MLLIHELYAIEERARGLTAAARLALRQELARPLLHKLRTYPGAPARGFAEGLTARAIRYVLNQWAALNRYCEDGDLSIDNS